MDITTVTSLISSLKVATDIAKFIKDSDVSLEKAESKLKLAELISTLADAKIEASEIQQSIVERDEKIRALEAEAKIRKSLKWNEPCYWLISEDQTETPYCQPCYDRSKALSRLHSDNNGAFECRVCGKSFKTNARKDRDAAEYTMAIRSMGRRM